VVAQSVETHRPPDAEPWTNNLTDSWHCADVTHLCGVDLGDPNADFAKGLIEVELHPSLRTCSLEVRLPVIMATKKALLPNPWVPNQVLKRATPTPV
jgi:hypothetical protein